MVTAKSFYFVLALSILLSSFILFDINSSLIWDELVYKELSGNVWDGYKSMLGENYRAPLFPLFLISSNSLAILHLEIALMVLIGLLLIYLIGKNLHSAECGLIAAALLGSNAYYFFWNHRVLSEPLAIIFILLAMLIFLKWQESRKPAFLCLAYLISALAFLTRYLAGILAVTFVIINLIEIKRKELKINNFILAILLLVLATAPLFILSQINYGSPFGMFMDNLENASIANANALFYIRNLLLFISPIMLAFFIFGLQKSLVQNKKIQVFAWFAVIYTVAVSFYMQKDARFFILALPSIALIASRGYFILVKQNPNIKFILNIALIIAVALPLLTGMYWAYTAKDNMLEITYSTDFVRGLEGEIASESLIHYQYYSDKTVVDYANQTADYYIWTRDKGLNYTNYINKNRIYELKGSIRGVAVYGGDLWDYA